MFWILHQFQILCSCANFPGSISFCMETCLEAYQGMLRKYVKWQLRVSDNLSIFVRCCKISLRWTEAENICLSLWCVWVFALVVIFRQIHKNRVYEADKNSAYFFTKYKNNKIHLFFQQGSFNRHRMALAEDLWI